VYIDSPTSTGAINGYEEQGLVEDFFSKSWAVYQKILSANYMFHNEFVGLTIAALQAINRPIHLLDIGCGDAIPILPLLNSCNVQSYTGYDISDRVLQECAANLSTVSFPVNLYCGSMEKLLADESGVFDVVYSSYAIHHLQDEAKASLYKRIAELLKAEGSFIYTDVYREEGESLSDYRKAYSDNINTYWNELNPEDKKEVIHHLNQFDFPAQEGYMLQKAAEAGFGILALQNVKRHCFIHLKKKSF